MTDEIEDIKKKYEGCGFGRYANGANSPVICTRPEGCFRRKLEKDIQLCGIWVKERDEKEKLPDQEVLNALGGKTNGS